jgi:DNA-binding response OmpR family regulator
MARILVVDDEVEVTMMLRDILERAGYEVIDAPDGEVALKVHQENPADLMIIDIIMPKKEGIETIMEVRRNFPEVKIIAISGGGRFEPGEYLMAAKEAGAMRTFSKPIGRDELLDAVRELLE